MFLKYTNLQTILLSNHIFYFSLLRSLHLGNKLKKNHFIGQRYFLKFMDSIIKEHISSQIYE